VTGPLLALFSGTLQVNPKVLLRLLNQRRFRLIFFDTFAGWAVNSRTNCDDRWD